MHQILDDDWGKPLEGLVEQDDLRIADERARSRDKRPDYSQVVIGLVVTPDGLPLAHEVLAGNTSDNKNAAQLPRQDRGAIRQGATHLGDGPRHPNRELLAKMCRSDPPLRYPAGLDQLLADYKKPEDLTGDDGLFKRQKKALIERALKAELTGHLGYENGYPAAAAATVATARVRRCCSPRTE